MSDVEIDLEAVNPVLHAQPQEVEDVKVVFVPFEDTEITVNQTRKLLKANVGQKVTRDEARILLEAKRGYLKD